MRNSRFKYDSWNRWKIIYIVERYEQYLRNKQRGPSKRNRRRQRKEGRRFDWKTEMRNSNGNFYYSQICIWYLTFSLITYRPVIFLFYFGKNICSVICACVCKVKTLAHLLKVDCGLCICIQIQQTSNRSVLSKKHQIIIQYLHEKNKTLKIRNSNTSFWVTEIRLLLERSTKNS